MKQENNLLYLLRAVIVLLLAWITSTMFSPTINSSAHFLQERLVQNQILCNQILSKQTTHSINELEKLIAKRPLDMDLPNTYRLAERECNLTLDTLNELFSQNISNQKLNEQIAETSNYLYQRIWTILQDFEKASPIITKQEIENFQAILPRFSYSINAKNEELIKALALGQIEEVKTRFSRFVSGRMCIITLEFDEFQPLVNTVTIKKNELSRIEVLFVPVSHQIPVSLKPLSVNNKSIPFVDGIATYKTVFKDASSKDLIVKGAFKTSFNEIVTLQDTFIIHPIQKQ